MLVILFRSKLTDQAGADYAAMDAELESLVKENTGFIRAKRYAAQDGERLTVVCGAMKNRCISGATWHVTVKRKEPGSSAGTVITRWKWQR